MNMPKIVIKTAMDLTPAGKRTARKVTLTQGQRIRWYVGGRIYATKPATVEMVALTNEWMADAKPS